MERRASSPVGMPGCYLYVMQYRYEYRRRLPHYQPDTKIFFITFCTYQRWYLPEHVRRIVLEACVSGNGTLFDLLAAVAVPDHVPLALAPRLRPDGTVPLAKIMQAILRIVSTSGKPRAWTARTSLAAGVLRSSASPGRGCGSENRLYAGESNAGGLGGKSTGLSLDLAERQWTGGDPRCGRVWLNAPCNASCPTGEDARRSIGQREQRSL
jgi:hypothetical protein